MTYTAELDRPCAEGDRTGRFHVFELPVDAVDMDSVLRFVDERVRKGSTPSSILCANPEKLYHLRSSAGLLPLFESADLVIPDGIGVVLAVRLLSGHKLARVTGADLMQEICEAAPSRGYRIFIYGSSEAVNAKAALVLRERYPGIDIVGAEHGYQTPGQMDTLVSRINEAHPDLLFVGLGSPLQELWIQQNVERLHVAVIQAVGGTLDTIAGTVRRAPRWMRACGLEWLYRFAAQPSRARRQLSRARFVVEVVRTRFSSRHRSMA
jgi:N-acetylglucosaminyldiphosphoundecaprenol N-acetyl-beta-D-mannosaminyltransferase